MSEIVADLHIHSRFSRATSRSLDLAALQRAAQRKGIRVVGTGDASHPGWLAELREQLEDDGAGLLRLAAPHAARASEGLPPGLRAPVSFLLSAEISNIYKRAGRTRKVHNLVLLPDLSAAERFSARLERVGNVRSDGRPILGLDSRDLLEIVLECDPRAALVPAHIWTPWFSALGALSGFDSIEECYGDLAPHVFAVETGLSSDPPMNWRLSSLDRYTLVSHSDAHSPEKLGREANLFRCAPSYDALLGALRRPGDGGFAGTLEFFPEEGKYHADGHRRCEQRLSPSATRDLDGRCPVCGRKVTVGVLHRVELLADRAEGTPRPGAPPFESLVPLAELLGEILGQGAATLGVARAYESLLQRVGPELYILRQAPPEVLRRHGSELLAEAVLRVRAGAVLREAGYDGEYGVARVFAPGELSARAGQLALAEVLGAASPRRGPQRAAVRPPAPATLAPRPEIPSASSQPAASASSAPSAASPEGEGEGDPLLRALDPAQRAAVLDEGQRPLLVVAGPGTGKTRTLTHRVAWAVLRQGVPPGQVLAVTFTVKAAQELRERLEGLLGAEVARAVQVGTFHSLCHSILRRHAAHAGLPADFSILDADGAWELFCSVDPGAAEGEPRRRSLQSAYAQIGRLRAAGREPTPEGEGAGLVGHWRAYCAALAEQGALDFDGLLERTCALLTGDVALRAEVCGSLRLVAVDEYQDVNPAQVRLLRLWAGSGTGLFAIGDPDQAIYGFRGAERAHLLEFESQWPGAQRLTLGRSYRSTDLILQASHQLLGPAASRAERCRSTITGGPRIVLREAPSERAEAEGVVALLEGALGGTGFFSFDSGRSGGEISDLSFGDVAILYRSHAQAPPLVEALERAGIPYQVARGRGEGAAPRLLGLLGGAAPGPGEAASLRALLHEEDELDPRAERVSLLTLHASKGLEFPLVFIVGCEDGLLPFAPPWRSPSAAEIDEERRLFYVGATRAERRLVLSWAHHRAGAPGGARIRSPFLDTLEARLTEEARPEGSARRPRDDGQLSLL